MTTVYIRTTSGGRHEDKTQASKLGIQESEGQHPRKQAWSSIALLPNNGASNGKENGK